MPDEDHFKLKFDKGKSMPGLVLEDFANAIKSIADVAAYGAQKYAPRSWVNVPDNTQRYTDAMMRHLLDHLSGEIIDKETGFTHLSHFAWNALAVLELQQREKKKYDMFDINTELGKNVFEKIKDHLNTKIKENLNEK